METGSDGVNPYGSPVPLQFGHGCDAVETAARSSFWLGVYSPLQFGHGCDAVETARTT